MNEQIFTVILVALSAIALYFLPGSTLAAAEIVTLKLIYISMLIGTTGSLVYFLRGTKYDIYAEIFDQNNSAAAILVGALILAVGLVIGK
jgi:hypothetical protein